MAKPKRAAKPAQKTIWMSRDSQGNATRKVYFWGDKPSSIAGQFYGEGGDLDHLDYLDHECDEFVRFCKIFGINAPEPGELVRVTFKAQTVQTLSTRASVVERLRTAKKFDRALMTEAAAWVESHEEEQEEEA